MKTLGHKPLIPEDVQMANCSFGRYVELGSANAMENVSMGDFSYSGPNCIFQNAEIGKFSNIAAHVRIGPTNHPMDRPTQHHFTYRRTLYGLGSTDDESFFQWRKEQMSFIGHDTWLGHGAIILSGVRIGTGAVIGAGSVVTNDIPDYAVAVGHPARVIRYRFNMEQQASLQAIAWWNWEYEKIKEGIEDFCSDIDSFIRKYGEK